MGCGNEIRKMESFLKTSIARLAQQLTDKHPLKLGARFASASRQFVKNRVGATERARGEIRFSAEIHLESGLLDFINWRSLGRNKPL